MTLKERLLEKYDRFIYRLAHKSIRRLYERDPGLAYLFKLWLNDWLKQNSVSKQTEVATEFFYNRIKDKELFI